MDIWYKSYIRPIIIAIAIIFWLKGSYRILDFFVKDTMTNNITLVITALIVLYFVCGNFIILGNIGSIPHDKNKSEIKMPQTTKLVKK